MWPDITRLVQPKLAPHQRFVPIPRAPARESGLYPGEPENCRRSLRQFVPILAHLGLLLAVFKVYRIEGPAFQHLVTLALVAVPIHYVLPFRFKKLFFVGVSVAGLIWVFGPTVSLYVLPLAAALIGVCYLPISWWGRTAIIATTALALGFARAGAGPIVPDAVWPVLGTMFMFRMIIYLYELKHAQQPERLTDTLSYFFLLPNYCFLHFPVVDYKTFLRSHFAANIHATQRVGLRMIVLGTVQLLTYRWIYQRYSCSPDDVDSAAGLARYLVCNYLLYFHVAGQFHTACGMLHLFGFQLPETHHNFLLASSFTDYWRRINIYWKDFMVRVVFNPVVFRLKRRPQALALACGTVVVFVATWALHAYQYFWIGGTWSFGVPDALFWGILGVLVLINVQWDARNPRRRAKGTDLHPRALAIRVLKTAATFTTIAILWSLWSSPSLSAWLAMFRRAFSA